MPCLEFMRVVGEECREIRFVELERVSWLRINVHTDYIESSIRIPLRRAPLATEQVQQFRPAHAAISNSSYMPPARFSTRLSRHWRAFRPPIGMAMSSSAYDMFESSSASASL